MGATLLVHIVAGGVGLLSGYTALLAAKGAGLHRRAGAVFVGAMLVMSLAGLAVTVARDVEPATNVPAALLTAYLVITALTTVRPPAGGGRGLALGALLVALGVGAASLTFGFEALAAGGRRNGMPAFPFFLFGVVAVLGSVGDVRVLRSGPLRGTRRLARHLWRMSFALFIAALSFFIGQADELPAALRVYPLLALFPLSVLASMGYWLWRVRSGRGPRRVAGAHGPVAADLAHPAAGVS